MKHKILSLASLCLLTVVSCTQEETFQENRVTRMSAELPEFLEENGTRSQVNVSASDGITYSWAIGDVLGIFPDEGDQVSFRLTESSLSADGKSATFDGGAWALKNGHIYYSYFPFSYENFSDSSNPTAIPVDYTGQSITEWGDTKNAGHYDFLAAGGTSSTNGALSFSFIRLGALLRLKFTLPATATYKKLILSADGNVLPVKGKVDLSATTIAYIPQTYTSSISVNLNDISGTKDQVAYVYLMLPPMTLLSQSKLLTVSLSCSSGTWTYSLCKAGDTVPQAIDFKANTIYKRDAVLQGIDPEGEMNEGDEEEEVYAENTLNGHEFVDLGLPSGTLWATCNVGASKPEEYGNYYAWGETKGYGEMDTSNENNFNYNAQGQSSQSPFIKTYYSAKTYKYYVDGDENHILKYNVNGTIDNEADTYFLSDNKTTLEPEDDAAHVNWGSGWHIPTNSQIKELLSCTKSTWTKMNGVYGNKITSKQQGYTDKFIFLPAGGERSSSTINGTGNRGYYWSSTLETSELGKAKVLYFTNSTSDGKISASSGHDSRYYGISVRPVCSLPSK